MIVGRPETPLEEVDERVEILGASVDALAARLGKLEKAVEDIRAMIKTRS